MTRLHYILGICILSLLGNFPPTFSAADNELQLWYDHPASQWVEALPVGNGRLGAMVYGGIENERLQINEDSLFTGKPHTYAHKGAIDFEKQIIKVSNKTILPINLAPGGGWIAKITKVRL